MKNKLQGARPHFDDIGGILKEIKKALQSGKLILGDNTLEFEKKFSKYIGTKYGIAISSATAGLELIMTYWNIFGQEVIMPTNTFIACANATIYANGKPVFCDIDPKTYCIDIEDLKRKITKKTKVIMAVHLAGLPDPNIFKIKKICREERIYLLEDCSHAHGATIKGKKVGSIGDAAVFSMYPTKIMTTGVGGIITTNDRELSSFAKSVRHHGQGKNLDNIINFGNNCLMDEMRTILGISQLKNLGKIIRKRNSIARRYMKEIDKIKGAEYISVPKRVRHSYYKFPVILDPKLNKNKIVNYMKKKGIEVGTLYLVPLHSQPIYSVMNQECPKADGALARQIVLPMHIGLNKRDIKLIINTLKKAIETEQQA